MTPEEKATVTIKNGGIIIFPTDTAFGIGCRIDNKASVDRLFILRKRPTSQAMPVLVDGIHMALSYLDNPSPIVLQLMRDYWPGALTIISNCLINKVYAPIRGEGSTIGMRMPAHSQVINIITQLGVPILGSSANFHGNPTPYRLEELDPNLIKLVDFVLPGDCTQKQVSTVVDCTLSPYKIVRSGALTLHSETDYRKTKK